MGKHLSKLRALEGSVNPEDSEQALLNCLRTPSPSVNWALAQPGFGLPYGCSMVLYGPPKGGKSVFLNGIVGQMHQDDPDAIAVKFDTELRSQFTTNPTMMRKFGIDEKRYLVFDVNEPDKVFDRIEKDIAAACQEGEKIKMVIIDSMSGISGRRSLNADTVNQQQIGDQAATIKDGLQRIMPTIRKYGIAFICTAHIRAEMDMAEQMRGKKVKMNAAWAAKHTFEYFCYIEPNQSKTGKVTLAGEEFTDPAIVDFMGKDQRMGHKVRLRVEDSSFPYGGRTAEFTLDFDNGIVNQYEEIYTLAKNHGLINCTGAWYNVEGEKYNGLVKCLEALRDNSELQKTLLSKVKHLDYKRIKGIKGEE